MPLNVSKVFKMHVSINQFMKMYIYIQFGFVLIAFMFRFNSIKMHLYILFCYYTFLNAILHLCLYYTIFFCCNSASYH